MKKIFYLALTCLFFSSCSKWLEVIPSNEQVKEDYWKTKEQVEAAVGGCYRAMIEDNVMKGLIGFGELRGDNLLSSTNSDQVRLLQCNIATETGLVKDVWGAVYTVIKNCNAVLAYADEALKNDPSLTVDELNAYKAEARAIRAYMYFFLVRNWRDVPLILIPSDDDKQDFSVAKTSEDKVLEQIVKDLVAAKKDCMVNYDELSESKYRVTKNACRAMLAEVYLWKREYQKCVTECDEVLASMKLLGLELAESETMASDIFYMGYSTESIWELAFSNTGKKNSQLADIFGQGSKTPQWTVNTPHILQKFENGETTTDSRLKYSINMNTTRSVIKYLCLACQDLDNPTETSKYTYSLRAESSTANWIVYRLPDIYLMKAEALVELEGAAKTVLELVNITYSRANPGYDQLKEENYSGQEALRKLVLTERQREFLFEGKRWFDLLRTARRLENDPTVILDEVSDLLPTLNQNMMTDPNAWFLPIPFEDIQRSHGILVQNPFYED